MLQTHALLRMLALREPMTTEELRADEVRAELDDLKVEIEKLKSKSAESGSSRTGRFDRYLDTLDAQRIEVRERLDAARHPDEDRWEDIRQGLKEAQQRLAIAKLAARSRFH